jgi:hypothetical protein
MPKHLKAEGEMVLPWRVWRVGDDGHQISVVAEAQTREELSFKRRSDWIYKTYHNRKPVDDVFGRPPEK